jgi:predicted Fe-Mo cluster-binding NifX family protein
MKRIAIPNANNVLSAHFGKAEFFNIFIIENNIIIKEEILPTPQHETGSFPSFLANENITDLIVSGVGGKAIEIFNANNISVHTGAPSLAPNIIIDEFLKGTLELNSNSCNHDNH